MPFCDRQILMILYSFFPRGILVTEEIHAREIAVPFYSQEQTRVICAIFRLYDSNRVILYQIFLFINSYSNSRGEKLKAYFIFRKVPRNNDTKYMYHITKTTSMNTCIFSIL